MWHNVNKYDRMECAKQQLTAPSKLNLITDTRKSIGKFQEHYGGMVIEEAGRAKRKGRTTITFPNGSHSHLCLRRLHEPFFRNATT